MLPDVPDSNVYKAIGIASWTFNSIMGYFSPPAMAGHCMFGQIFGTLHLYQVSFLLLPLKIEAIKIAFLPDNL